eukprot:SAG31_NODE_25712_length_456_cov_0.599440_1_plen_91_part_10
MVLKNNCLRTARATRTRVSREEDDGEDVWRARIDVAATKIISDGRNTGSSTATQADLHRWLQSKDAKPWLPKAGGPYHTRSRWWAATQKLE